MLLALALRPMFTSPRLAGLWRHSVEIAQCCEGIAKATGIMPGEEALLLGLIHDIGRIAIQNAPAPAARAYARLEQKGCPPVYTERLLFGCQHGEIGGSILSGWHFPESMIQAVQYHHRPADCGSIPAALLYLAEFWVDPDEDLPSARHFHAAAHRIGVSVEMLSRAAKDDIALTALLGTQAA
jgi:hypothetical protein